MVISLEQFQRLTGYSHIPRKPSRGRGPATQTTPPGNAPGENRERLRMGLARATSPWAAQQLAGSSAEIAMRNGGDLGGEEEPEGGGISR